MIQDQQNSESVKLLAASQAVDREMTPAELRGWIEYSFWVASFLSPLMIWWNGPSVSFDQKVIRIGLVVLSLFGAIGLRVYSLMLKHRS